MSAEPVQAEDPNDPQVILRDQPERERAEFLRQYHEAIDAAHDPAGYRQLQRLLHAWRLTVIAAGRAGYYEELAAVQSGRAQTRPAEEAFPDWCYPPFLVNTERHCRRIWDIGKARAEIPNRGSR